MRTLLASAALAWLMASPLAAQEKLPHTVTDKLTEDDPADKVFGQRGCKAKEHEVELKAGTYRVNLSSGAFDTFLRVTDPNGRIIAQDDDSGGGLNSMAVFEAKSDGKYKLTATAFVPGLGEYKLVVAVGTKVDILGMQVRTLPAMPPAKQVETLDAVANHLDGLGEKIDAQAVQMAMQAVVSIDQNPKLAGEWSKRFGAALAKAENPNFGRAAKALQAATRRYALPGNVMEVKGTLVDGKKFDLSQHKGKVVLVDFWASWCGPCIGEIPNMLKAYETYHDKGFEIIGISLDFDVTKLEKFVEARKIPWPSIYERGVKNQPLAEHYGVFGIPLAILVDREGRVVSMNARGPELERQLSKLFEDKK